MEKAFSSLPSWERGLKFLKMKTKFEQERVAPLVGAWIEIVTQAVTPKHTASLPSWERGLKLIIPHKPEKNDPRRSPRGSVD